MQSFDSVNHGRRAFLKSGALILAAGALDAVALDRLFAQENVAKDALRVALITDLHYADKAPAGTRHYRETLDKLAEAAEQFSREKPAFIVELGDIVDAADSVEVELGYLRRVNAVFSAISKDRHYVLGNHCVQTLTKEEFLDAVERKRSYDSFDSGGFHFVTLDACFIPNGAPYGRKNSQWNNANIPPAEVEWLEADLKATDKKVIVFTHQRLDVDNDYGIKNGPAVRKVLQDSGKVLAVFQGHSHQNDYREVAGIHYCTLVAMVEGKGAENNAYSVLDVAPDGTIAVRGFRKQKKYDWPAKRS